MKKTSFILTVAVFLLSSVINGQELDMEQKGLKIAKEADNRDYGFGDTSSHMEMILINKHGASSIRKLRNRILEQKQDGDKSIIIFDSPGDVKGTAFLSYTHKKGSDDQWLYLPALKRVKRIASSNKSGPFMGSEFSYEDISSQEIEKYTYKYLKNEKLNGEDHFVIKRFPVDKKSGYSFQVVWLDSTEYRTSKVEYYDRKKTLLKTLNNSKFKKYLNRYWRPNKMLMKNHQTGKSTVLNFSNYKFKTGLKDKDFSKNALQKLR